jgi:hypothetical protein
MKREEAIAILREIVESSCIALKSVSLVNIKSDSYELHLKPEDDTSDSLKPIVEKHYLKLKEANGTIIIYREHEGSK